MSEVEAMRRGVLCAGATMMSSLLAGAGPAAAQTRPTTPKDLIEQFAAAIIAHDPDRIAGFYTDKAMLLTSEGQIIQGRDHIREAFACRVASGPPPTRLVNAHSGGGPRFGVISWTWATIIARPGQVPQHRRAHSILYLKNLTAGWHVVADMFQVFEPPQD
ncbi:YybH family protein [Neoroseomonas lacus]|uniref:SnoaL-like domain-containing protein n=1 Tax=Neoroseomonas lacus TaxID=287609 RepID=A0A917NJI2_9PROT|nr:nuclear transport factor 2 family protein [Neoroseomonas lacus]GGJ06007.1 hypothetical protein GCM10011320_10970 [Neoroseomonas lacus]